jgi:hypothetical protein
MDFGLDRARFALLQPLFGLLLCFWGVKRHHRLVHRNDII